LRRDDATPELWADFCHWRDSDPEHACAFEQVALLWEDIGDLADDRAIVRARIDALTFTAAPAERRRVPWAAAAALLLTIGLTGTLMDRAGWLTSETPTNKAVIAASTPTPGEPLVRKSDTGPAGDAKPFAARYRTVIGQQATFRLPDGSRIDLNTDSLIAVSYSGERRVLRLLRGEAIFRVARDPDRPFSVIAGNEKVIALGTIFAVRKDDRQVRVTLLEGKVRIERDDMAVGGDRADLIPGEQIMLPARQPFEISRASFDDAASWRSGRLRFDGLPLSDVVTEINRYTDRKLVVGSPAVGAMRISATMRIGSADNFANALAAGFPVRLVDQRNGDILILVDGGAAAAPKE
jgi:transmembrane sensor